MRKVPRRIEGKSRRGQEPTPPGTGRLHGDEQSKIFCHLNVKYFAFSSIHNAVIAVFQKKGLADNELYILNEGVRYVPSEENSPPLCDQLTAFCGCHSMLQPGPVFAAFLVDGLVCV